MTDPESSERPTWLERISQAFAVLVLVLLAAGIGFAVIGIYPNKIPTIKNPSIVDNIFDSRVVILAARIALMFAAAYVAVSVVGLIASRRWLSQLGPFRASDPIARLDESGEALESDLHGALEAIQELEQRLAESDDALAKTRVDIGALLDHLDMMEAEKEGTNGA